MKLAHLSLCCCAKQVLSVEQEQGLQSLCRFPISISATSAFSQISFNYMVTVLQICCESLSQSRT